MGCGGGLLSEALAKVGARVTGIDIAEKSIGIARTHALQSGMNIHYEVGEPEDLVRQDVRYDVVLNMEVIEHVPDPEKLIDTCARLTRVGGVTFVATINRNLLSWVTAIVGAEYILGWLPRGTHQWRRFLKPAEIEAMLERSAMTVRQRRGVRINPFNRRFSITESTPVNYMLVATRDGVANIDGYRPVSKWLIRELRSDHAGETGAVAIYRGILTTTRDEGIKEFALRHLATEQEHLEIMQHLLPERQRSRLLPLWRASGFALGACTALFGAGATFATIDAVESFVDQHYSRQIARLTASGEAAYIRRQMEKCHADEVDHRDEARKWHHNGLLARTWARVVGLGSRLAVSVARRI